MEIDNTKEGGFVMKTFFGGTFMNKKQLEEAGINYPIKLEYYKNINENEWGKEKENFSRFGIKVVKTEYKPGETKVENKEIRYLSNDEKRINEVLTIFKEHEVTPIAAEDVLSDLSQKRFY